MHGSQILHFMMLKSNVKGKKGKTDNEVGVKVFL